MSLDKKEDGNASNSQDGNIRKPSGILDWTITESLTLRVANVLRN